jgi:hypothetical protein
VEPQPAASMEVATMAVAVAAPPTLPVPAPAGSPRAAVVEILDDDDDPPQGWDQWASAPVSAPETSAGALVARGNVGATLHRVLVIARWTRSAPGAGARGCRHPAGPLHRGSGRARALAGAPQPRRLAQPGAERGVADPQRSGVACLPGQLGFVESRNSFPRFLFVCVFSDARPSRSACWWQELERRVPVAIRRPQPP